MFNTLYYGLPESIWYDYLKQVEDKFYEEDIGQWILGIYPTGNRIFGLEQEDPGLLCLYTDSESNILNPLNNIEESKISYFSHSGSFVKFIDLWTWVTNFSKPLKSLDQLIPCFSDSFFEEEMFEPILEAIYNFITNNTIKWETTEPLVARTFYLLNNTKNFNPNINSEWGKVSLFNNLNFISSKDAEIREHLLNNRYINPSWAWSYIDLLQRQEIKEKSFNYNKDLQEIGKRTSNFYRSILL